MSNEIKNTAGGHLSPFERIKRTNDANNEHWESRDLAKVLEYTQYRNFEAVIEKAKLACFNSGHRIEDGSVFCCVQRYGVITFSWPTQPRIRAS